MTLCNYAVNYSTCVTLGSNSSSVVKREEKKQRIKKTLGLNPNPGKVKKQYARPCILVKGISFGRHDTQHNDSQHNDTQHEGLICDTQHELTLCNYAECHVLITVMLCVIIVSVIHYAECCYAEYRGATHGT